MQILKRGLLELSLKIYDRYVALDQTNKYKLVIKSTKINNKEKEMLKDINIVSK